MRRELANARELSRQHYSSEPRCCLRGRHAVSRHRGRAGACFRFQHRQARVGNDNRGREPRRVGAVGSDRVERPCLCRQRRQRLQGRQGTYVRARRDDRQDCLGILSRAQERWRYGPRTVGREPAQRLHMENDPGIPITGGGTWTSYTLDPQTGLLYVPGGNPAPDYVIGVREGENLYTDSVVVLDAKTGDYKRHFKVVLKDWHDWDVSNPPILIQTAGCKHLMVVAPKDGYLYCFDRTNNSQLYKVPVTQIENVAAAFEPGESVHFCPGPVGGEEWNSPGYDPQTHLI